eukprot:4411476-Pyramimonas_sp.AAC.1
MPIAPTACSHPVHGRLLQTQRWKEVSVPMPTSQGRHVAGYCLATVYGVATESNETLFNDVWQAAALRGSAA